MNLRLLTLLLSCSIFFTQITAQIIGDTSVCVGDIETYSISPSAGSTYNWNQTGGLQLGPANLDSFVIKWSVVGVGTVNLLVNTPGGPINQVLNVNVNPLPAPLISHDPYPTCPPTDIDNPATGQSSPPSPCEKVCKGTTIVYTTPLNPGSSYIWIASGNSSISGATSNVATVTWDNTGFGSLKIIETNSWGCIDSTSNCFEKVNPPTALFTNPANACKNSTVNFNNLSTGATSYNWTFGDGGSSTLFSPSHAYSTAGTYTITLIVENDCHCIDTFQNTITIDSLPGPEITCPSTVCAGDTAIYNVVGANISCTYNWFAVGGTIISGAGTPNVSVAWGAGQIGTLGLYITGCATVCSDTTFFTIPIIPVIGAIAGPSKVCPGDCFTYSLPPFSGTVFTWSLGGACGIINDSTSCEDIEICWPSYLYQCDDTLNVSYYNAFLNCGGSSSKTILLRPKSVINGPSLACVNDLSSYNEANGFPCNWSISPAGPTFSPGGSSPSISVNWNNFTGNFLITAIVSNPTLACNDTSYYQVEVVAPPIAPIITGDTLICPNSSAIYCATSPNIVNWIVTGGSPSSGIGNCMSVTWGPSGPYIIQAFVQSPINPFCYSDTTGDTLTSINGLIPVLTGSLTACANSSNSYSTSSSYPPSAIYAWSMLPANAGAILSSSSALTLIEWGNNAPGTVFLTLDVTVCGQVYSNTMTIVLNPTPTSSILQLGSLCPGGTTQLLASGGVGYAWTGPGGFSALANPVTISSGGLYQLTVTNANGCSVLDQIKVTPVSGPTASISSGELLIHCIPAGPYQDTLCALGNPSYQYLWSNLATTQCIIVSAPGSYSVTVTDINTLCTSLSNVLVVSEDSCNGTGTGNPCIPQGSVDFTHSLCNPISFVNTSVNASGFFWNFGDGNTSTLTNPSHNYTMAGFYYVQLSGLVPGIQIPPDTCLLTQGHRVEIPLAAKFDHVVGCAADSVCFTDVSTYTAGNNITSWLWNFGDANFSSIPSPCHNYASSGTYFVSLTISNGICSSVYLDTILVPAPPIALFSAPDTVCLNRPVTFSDLSIGGVNAWNWNFGDAGTSLNQNPNHSYNLIGNYPVVLIVKDTLGCLDTIQNAIEVIGPIATGNIIALPDTIVCEGNSIQLIAPFCTGCAYSWSTGSTNDSIIVNVTGIYTVSITDVNGCIYSTSISIVVKSKPAAIILNSGDDEFCLGEFVNLSAPFNPNWTYLWNTNDIPNNGSILPSIFVFPGVAGTYTYQLIVNDTMSGCVDTSLVTTIIVHPIPIPPIITAIGPSSFCFGDSVVLYGFHPDTSLTFLWSTGEVSDSIIVFEDGCYALQVIDTNACKALAFYCVTVYPLPDVCAFYEGCVDTCSPYTIIGPVGAASYQWLFNGIPILGANAPNYTTSLSGAYSQILTSGFGCVDTTGIINLNLYPCNDSLCAELYIDSIFCDSLGHYQMIYHVTNVSASSVSQVNLEILPPFVSLPIAPIVNYQIIPPGGTSSSLTALIYNANPGDSLCFRSHITSYDSLGNETLCCYTDTQCIIAPPCDVDSNCCYFDYVSDTIWCEQTSAGTQYFFEIKIDACGELDIHPLNTGALTLTYPLIVSSGITTITGSYFPGPGETDLCLIFMMIGADGTLCADTTICLPLNCDKHPLPCDWERNPELCQNNSTTYFYFGSTIGLSLNWSFPGGSPSTASGAGPHSIYYASSGTYPVSLTLTNSAGSTTCQDSIIVHPKPIGTISQVGSSLQAFPSGMTYQWYNGPALGSILPGESNQFFTPTSPQDGIYCVVITSFKGCIDTVCADYLRVGINDLDLGALKLYPNPNSGSFNLSLEAFDPAIIQMSMTNVLGVQIYHKELSLQFGSNLFFLELTDLSKGVYLLNLKDEEGKQKILKVLID